jgi:glutamyl-tRNA synthetase
MQLIEAGHAYYAFDTAEDLEGMRERLKASNVDAKYDAITRSTMKNSLTLSEDEVGKRLENGDPYVVRFKLPRKEEVKFHDEIRGWVSFNTAQLDDKVLYKSDGMPTYHLANVVDDYLMQISHVITFYYTVPLGGKM